MKRRSKVPSYSPESSDCEKAEETSEPDVPSYNAAIRACEAQEAEGVERWLVRQCDHTHGVHMLDVVRQLERDGGDLESVAAYLASRRCKETFIVEGERLALVEARKGCETENARREDCEKL